MRRAGCSWLLLALLPATAGAARASEDDDLKLIPQEIQEPVAPASSPPASAPSPAPPSRLDKKIFLEDAFTVAGPERDVPVPFPSTVYRWQNRTSFDLYLQWHPCKPLTLLFSDRFNVLEQEHVEFQSRQTPRNDFREAYLTWEPAASLFLEAGRINLRNGAALGFNPTDFFRRRTLVGQASADPSAVRQNRLGTVMVRGQKIWSRASLSLAYAPKLFAPSAIVRTNQYGVDPRLDATNAAHRVLATASLDIGAFSPQLLGIFERHRSKIGFNVTRPLGDAVVAYLEWAGGIEANLLARSYAYAQDTRTLPPDVPIVMLPDTRTSFRSDLATGASWTIGRKVTLNVEYHFHQAGFTRRDWQDWFDLGALPGAAPQVWYVRAYANDQQEPMSRHQIFARLAWPRAMTSKLELSAFAFVNPLDGSTFAQAIAAYYLSDAWTLAAYGSLSAGATRSERGSLPQLGSVALQLVRYL